jgi:hypothetical protein
MSSNGHELAILGKLHGLIVCCILGMLMRCGEEKHVCGGMRFYALAAKPLE